MVWSNLWYLVPVSTFKSSNSCIWDHWLIDGITRARWIIMFLFAHVLLPFTFVLFILNTFLAWSCWFRCCRLIFPFVGINELSTSISSIFIRITDLFSIITFITPSIKRRCITAFIIPIYCTSRSVISIIADEWLIFLQQLQISFYFRMCLISL